MWFDSCLGAGTVGGGSSVWGNKRALLYPRFPGNGSARMLIVQYNRRQQSFGGSFAHKRPV